MRRENVKVIGLGGIGTVLLPILCRMLAFSKKRYLVTLVDGDSYEARNAIRQSFRIKGNKAEVKCRELSSAFPRLAFRPHAGYVTEENTPRVIQENDTVFLCVDNHATRKIVSDRCRKLKNVVLISGGNELTDGNVQIYIRRKGRDVTLPLDAVHPEIARPADTVPGETQGCENALRAGNRQLLIANAAAAFGMLMNFWRLEENLIDGIGETYFTLPKGIVQTMPRPGRRKRS